MACNHKPIFAVQNSANKGLCKQKYGKPNNWYFLDTVFPEKAFFRVKQKQEPGQSTPIVV
jgi:hypothetical protein